jgi:hypothetical protein
VAIPSGTAIDAGQRSWVMPGQAGVTSAAEGPEPWRGFGVFPDGCLPLLLVQVGGRPIQPVLAPGRTDVDVDHVLQEPELVGRSAE